MRSPLSRTTASLSVLVLALALGTTACGDDAEAGTTTQTAAPTAGQTTAAPTDPGVTVVSEPTLVAGDPVPAPTGRVVLTLEGVPTTNVEDRLELDLDTLEKMGVVEYTVFDRQAEGRDVTFSGPLVRDVLAVAGATGTTMHTVALNDYAVDVPVSDAEDLPLMLATRADGTKMTVARYGPTRFVYPTEGYDLDQTVYDARWIWQLARIEVE